MADYVKVDGVAAADIVKIDGVAIADVVNRNGATKPSAAAYDWSESLWMDDNLDSDLGSWSEAGSERELQNVSYGRTYIPVLDDSSGTKTLKILFVGEHHHTADDFVAMGEGTRVTVGGSQNIVAISDTGIIFAGDGNLTDGRHGLQIQHKHDAKSDTYFRTTVVMDCTSNVVKCIAHWQSRANSLGDFFSFNDAWDAPTEERWGFEYDPDTNTWTNDGPYNRGNWKGTYPGTDRDTNVNGDGDGFEATMATYYVDSDTDEHRMWYIKTG